MDRKKIFIIEDEAVILAALNAQFSSLDFLVEANDGSENIKSILEKIILNNPDYIILDLVLPQSDGVELLKAIKASSEIASIPVFIFTNFSDADTRARCKDIGAEYYFIKTEFNIDEFVTKFRRIAENLNKKSL